MARSMSQSLIRLMMSNMFSLLAVLIIYVLGAVMKGKHYGKYFQTALIVINFWKGIWNYFAWLEDQMCVEYLGKENGNKGRHLLIIRTEGPILKLLVNFSWRQYCGYWHGISSQKRIILSCFCRCIIPGLYIYIFT